MTSKKQSEEITLAVIQNDIGYIKETMRGLDQKVSTHYVSHEEFEPIKKIVYGMVGLILLAVAGGLVSLVVK